MKCRKCGAEITQNAKFCIKCGTPAAAQPAQRSVQSAGTAQMAGRTAQTTNRMAQSAGRTAQTANRTAQTAGKTAQTANRTAQTAGRTAQTANRTAQTAGGQVPPAQQNTAFLPYGESKILAKSLTPINQVIPDYNPALDYRPIGMWGYFGYGILFGIPFVGWIILIIFSLGGTRNVNLRNFARSKFCFLIIMVFLWIFLYVAGASLLYMM